VSILDTYKWAVSHYANWQSAVAVGLVFVVLPAAAFTVSRLTRNRSS
jgi:hypothetical protein